MLATLALSLIASSSLAMAGTTPAATATPHVEGQMIVAVNESGASAQGGVNKTETQANAIESIGIDVISSLTGMPGEMSNMAVTDEAFKQQVINTMGYVYLVNYTEDNYSNLEAAQKDITTKLKAKGLDVKYVEPNYTLRASETLSTSSTHPNQEWQYNMIKAPEAWALAGDTSAVKVAVLDTGIDNNHPNLTNFVNMSLAKTFVGGTTMDVSQHGTHVAGTIASYGSVGGVMQSASLIPVKVLGDDGSGSLYGIEQGILYAAQIKADVINMSLGGGGFSQSMFDACQTAVDAGVIILAASGNNSTGTISYPAKYTNCIAVGAVDINRKRASFSQYGAGLAIMAPGKDIYSTIPNASYDTFSGTSMATPHMAGVAGLLKGINKSLTSEQVRQIITATAQPAGPANEYGAGIVNAFAACQQAGGVVPPVEKTTSTTVATDKATYYRGNSIYLTATVTDGEGAALAGATVNFVITKPNGTKMTLTGTTDADGEVNKTLTTSTSTGRGTYKIQATTTLADYESSVASSTFVIK